MVVFGAMRRLQRDDKKRDKERGYMILKVRVMCNESETKIVSEQRTIYITITYYTVYNTLRSIHNLAIVAIVQCIQYTIT